MTDDAGIGVDVVQVSRLRDAVGRWGDRFVERLFTAAELCATRRGQGFRWPSLAGRFAAKEAAKKVFAARGHAADWNEIEVVTGGGGEPLLRLHGRARRAAELCGFETMQVSISHEREIAVAVVLAR